LNPRVNLSTETDASRLFDDDFLRQFDLVVVTDVDIPTAVSFPLAWPGFRDTFLRLTLLDYCCQLAVNEQTRRLGKKFMAAASVGMDGWMFADLLSHDFIVCVPPLFSSFQLPLMLLKTETLGSLHSDKTKTVSQGETVVVPTKSTLEYAPLSRALEHKFGTLKKRELKRTGTVLWGLLGAYNEDGSLFAGVFGEGALTMLLRREQPCLRPSATPHPGPSLLSPALRSRSTLRL
jgi:ubiquitin-like 1-activating enzyme E1 A